MAQVSVSIDCDPSLQKKKKKTGQASSCCLPRENLHGFVNLTESSLSICAHECLAGVTLGQHVLLLAFAGLWGSLTRSFQTLVDSLEDSILG